MFPSTYFPPAYFAPAYFPECAFAPDFVSALVAYWRNDAVLTAISGKLHLGVAPPKAAKPYCVYSGIAGTAGGRNTMKGYWDDQHFQIAVWDTLADRATQSGRTIEAELDKLIATPLRFANGYQMALFRSGDNLTRAEGYGAGGTIDFPVVLMYAARVGRNRA